MGDNYRKRVGQFIKKLMQEPVIVNGERHDDSLIASSIEKFAAVNTSMNLDKS